MADGVAEQRLRPFQFTDQLLGVRVDQQFVVVEAMAVLRIVRTINTVAVDQPRVSVGQIAVVDLVGVFRKLDTLQLHFTGRIEQAEFDFGGVGREQGEVDAQTVPAGTERKGKPFTNARRGAGRIIVRSGAFICRWS